MLKKTLSSIFICSLFALNIQAQTSKIDSSEMVTLRIDPETARGVAVSQVFDEVKFIPLETTKESLFGSISGLKVVDEHFVIYDYDTKSVLIFTSEGKYVAKVNSSKIEKDENEKGDQNFYGFTIKNDAGKNYIVVSSRKNTFYFDLDGKLKTKKPISKTDDDSENRFQFANKETTIKESYEVKKDKDSIYYNLAILNNKKPTALYFPFKADRFKDDQFISSGNLITDSEIPNELFYINYYDYNIYKIKPTALFLTYHFIFPANNTLPKDFMDNPIYKNKRIAFFEKNPSIFFGIGNPYKIGDNLYFMTNNWGWSQDKKSALIYNLKSGSLTSIKHIEPDSLSYFLPVTDAGSFNDFNNTGFHLYKNNYFYTSYSSLAMFSFKEQSKEKNAKYSDALNNYFKTSDKKSNPVLIQLKPKTN